MARERVEGHPPVQSATTLPQNANEERDHRLHRYLVTMGIRTLCFILAVVTTGWVRWTFVAFAVVLPYVAVVAVNAVAPRVMGRSAPVTPTGQGPKAINR